MIEAVEQLIARFDFAACRKHMEETGWKWGWPTARMYVPTVEEMRETVRVLAWDAARDKPTGKASCESGGFLVRRDAEGRWSIRFRSRKARDPAIAEIREGQALPTPDVKLCQSIDEARAQIPPGLVCLGREPADLPSIVETWI